MIPVKIIKYTSAKQIKKLDRMYTYFCLTFSDFKGTAILPEQFQFLESLYYVTDCSRVDTVGDRAFASCTNLQRFDAGASFIGKEAFAFCSALTDFNFYDLKKLSESSFFCSGLKKVCLPDFIQEIPESCFEGCLSLKVLNLNKVELIGKNAFSTCGLKVVDLPFTLEEIKPYAFTSCFSLKDVICESTTPPKIAATSFISSPIENIWFFSKESMDNYSNNKVWKKYESKFKLTTPSQLKKYLQTIK